MSSGAHHIELARLLADTFMVVVPDRRGRGLSGPYGTGDELQQELDDVAALLGATGATNLWGLSSGACIALHAARTAHFARNRSPVSLQSDQSFRSFRSPAEGGLGRLT
jgi:pimeloyl-ACP methyl ester carboxylesterase